MIPVILSGGSGNRLWPLSRESYPKQLLNLIGANSLLQNTVLRALQITKNTPIIVCSQNHRFMIADQLNEISVNPSHIFLEPIGRNTAPAI
jgi:mannose-1-phosphate guanylyltransferase